MVTMDHFGTEVVLMTIGFVAAWAAAELAVMIATHKSEDDAEE